MHPVVSVIVPVYNTSDYLPRCITSIVNQTLHDFQCFLIDDGALDTSGMLCEQQSLLDSRFITIHHQNSGQSAARNHALDLCQGEYLWFCDSDDWAERELLDYAVNRAIQDHADLLRFQNYVDRDDSSPEVAISFGDFQTTFHSAKDKIDFILKIILNYKIGWEMWTSIFRTDIIQRHSIRFPKGINIAEDLYLNILFIFYANHISGLSIPLYHYCLRNNSTTGGGKIIPANINRANILAKMLFDKCQDNEIRYQFSFIHHDLIVSECQKLPPLSTRQGIRCLTRQLTQMKYCDFFSSMCRNYLPNASTWRDKNITRFFLKQNTCFLYCSENVHKIIYQVKRIRRFIYRKIGLLPPLDLPKLPLSTIPSSELFLEKKQMMLEMMQVIHDFLEKHHLRYHLAYGTAIGAIRHRGYIPWDDDIDIMMPFEDYLKFVKLWECYGDHVNYYLQTKFNDPNLIGIHSRLRKNGTTSMDPIGYYLPLHWGVPIDIFPWFHFPKGRWGSQFVNWIKQRYIKYGNMIPEHYYAPKWMKSYWYILTYLLFILLRWMNFIYKNSELICDLSNRPPFLVSTIFPCHSTPFEKHNFMVPYDCNTYLTKIFGNYLILPPEEERKPHPYAILDLKHDFSQYVKYDVSYLKRKHFK